GPYSGIEPPSHEARHRSVPRRPRLLRVRLVQHGPEEDALGLGVVPISYFHAAVLGLLQGVSELFPVSSLGHTVILPKLFGWDIHQSAPYFLTFLVALHLATALVLLGFFWQDWVRIVKGLGRSLRDREIGPEDADAKLGWLLVVGTIPAGLLGITLQDKLRTLFASPQYAAIFLALNGLLLYGSQGNGVRGPALVGALCSALTAYLAVRFLMKYFETRTLLPFAIYCGVAGTAAAVYFAVS